MIPNNEWKPHRSATAALTGEGLLRVVRGDFQGAPGALAAVSVKAGIRYRFVITAIANCNVKLFVGDKFRKRIIDNPPRISTTIPEERSITFTALEDGTVYVGLQFRPLDNPISVDWRTNEFLLMSASVDELPRVKGVVGGMATMPSRLASLEKTVSSVIDQLDHIFIHLNGFTDVPDFLVHSKKITVTRSQQLGDLRNSGKFLAAAEADDESIVFTLDDDINYPSNYVTKLTEALERFGRKAVVGVHGIIFPPRPQSFFARLTTHFGQAQLVDVPVSCLGTGTIAFYAGHLRPLMADFERHGMADLYFARLAKSTDLPLISIARREAWLSDANIGSVVDNSLYGETRRDATDRDFALREGAPWGFEQIRLALTRQLGDDWSQRLEPAASGFPELWALA